MRKSLSDITIKNADLGEIEAVFSTFDVIDLDGDVTVKGAFTEGSPVVISAYGHKSWEGLLPVGKGTIHEIGDTAVLKGRFFLNTTHGRDTWETVKELSESGLQEWSYSLHDVESRKDTVDGRKVNVIEKVRVKEVSPVLLGAGIGTTTLSTKALTSVTRDELRAAALARWGDDGTWVYVEDFDPEESYAIVSVETDESSDLVQVSYTVQDGAIEFADEQTEVVRTVAYARKGTFSEHAAQVLASVDGLAIRAAEVVALRTEKGKTISTASAELLRSIELRCTSLKSLIEPDTPESEPHRAADTDDIAGEFLRFVAISQGVTL